MFPLPEALLLCEGPPPALALGASLTAREEAATSFRLITLFWVSMANCEPAGLSQFYKHRGGTRGKEQTENTLPL